MINSFNNKNNKGEYVIDKRRLIDILPYQIENFPRIDALCDKKEGVWRKYSSVQIKEIVDKFSLGLLKMGFQRGDKFAIISPNRTEWTFVDLGILQMGGVDVPIYPNMSETDYNYIFNDAQVKLVFVADKELYEKVKKVIPKAKSVREIYTFDQISGAKHWSEISADSDTSLLNELKLIEESLTEQDLATIIYTSGTTGVPKGVMLTHLNILSNILSLHKIIPINFSHRMISFLPICHIFERTAVYFYLSIGGAIYFAESIDKVAENLLEIKPNYFTTVPRLLEKIFEVIMSKGRELKGLKK